MYSSEFYSNLSNRYQEAYESRPDRGEDLRRELEREIFAAWPPTEPSDARVLLGAVVVSPSTAWSRLLATAGSLQSSIAAVLKEFEDDIYAQIARADADTFWTKQRPGPHR